jgi:LuxR family maltose regulon positive regulatory protein
MDRRLTLISAPAGFGKTTLLGEWISGSRQPVAWLSLEEADNDPMRFWAYFIGALQLLQEDLASDSRDFLREEGQQTRLAQLEPFMTILVNDLSAYPQEFAFVLDDYHQITSQAIHEAIGFLIDHLPPRMHLIMTSRADPPLPLARLRARSQMIELREEDLRFTAEEAMAFLNHVMKLGLTVDQIAALETRTEGWIAGLQLAAISLQKTEDTGEFIESFTGSHRFILEYLVDEVLYRQPEEVQSFLLATSILGRFTGSLCDALTGTRDGEEMIRHMERANLFIIPLDDQRRWHRYHHLFADLLRSRLQEQEPDRVPILHQRAVEWFEREGLLPEAIDHAVTMGDFEKAAQLIEQTAETQRQQGEIATLTGWMSALPASIRRSHPALCLAYARSLVDTSQNAAIEELVEEAETALEAGRSSGTPKTPSSLIGQSAALRAYLAMIRHQHEATIVYSWRAREWLGEDEARWRSFVGLIQASAYRFTNEWAAAAQTYLESYELSQAAGDRVNALLALSLRGEVLQAQGDLHLAAAQYEQVLQLAREWAIPNAPVTGYALVGLGRTWCEWNDLVAADRLVRSGIERGQKAGIQDILLRGGLALARIRQGQGDSAGALSALADAEVPARKMGLADLTGWIGAVRALVWLAHGDTGAALRWADSFTSHPQDAVYPAIAIALAKVRQFEGRPDEALGLLEHALQSAQAVGRLGNAVQILVVKASVLGRQGDIANALATLAQALTLAEPQGYLRTFLEEGEPMRSLIDDFRTSILARGRGADQTHQQAPLDYTNRLLAAFTAASVTRPAAATVHSPASGLPAQVLPARMLPEPLSERELEVLRLVAAGLSSRAISDRDVVSINTVKTQLRSIYGKLGAHNRGDALATARELGLL